MKNNISFISFAENIKKYIFNTNERYHKWGIENNDSFKLLELYDSVPEHESAINFKEQLITGKGLNGEEIDLWTLKKFNLDYLIFGGFTAKVIKLRNGNFTIEYVDISKCRFSPEKDKIGFAEDWDKYKVEITWYPIAESGKLAKGESIFYFKNNKSRELYPRPSYLSSLVNVDTASAMSKYHNSNANNGFVPSTIINFNAGNVDDDAKRDIEKSIKEKFTGPNASRFLLSFQESSEQAVTLSKLENDNMDQKFESLQKFVQNEILIAHQITSGQLIGVKPENQGFSATEYQESLNVFKETVIQPSRLELEYAYSKLFGIDITFISDEPVAQPTEEPTEEEQIINSNTTI